MRILQTFLRRSGILLPLALILIGLILYLCSSPFAPTLVRTPGTFYMVHTQSKVVSLTFDDGPDPLFTAQVLDILQREHIKATFFVLGELASENPTLIQRIAKEGHEIGNHSYTHDYRQRHLSEELLKTDQAVFNAAKIHTRFYRPPGGAVSKTQLQIIKESNHVVTLWSLDSRDWVNPGANQIVQNVTDSVFPGAIILLHDGGDKRGQTVTALEPIIKDLKDKGYRFVTLEELKALDGSSIPTGWD